MLQKMFMKNRLLIIDRQLKRKTLANKKLFMIDRKKRKTEHPSTFGNQEGNSKKPDLQNADGVDEGNGKVISGFRKKGIESSRPVTTGRKLKRKLTYILKKQIRERKKRKMKKVEDADEVVEPTDRISELPEPIIHHILSRLRCPSDVARTSVLCKKWRTIWTSFFTLDFDQKRFKASGDVREKFIAFVDNSLETKLEPMHTVYKFKLSVYQLSTKLNLCMHSWISAAIDKDVKEIEIHVEKNKKRHYVLPYMLLSAETLTSLKLYGCRFDSKVGIHLCNLKELSIKKVHVTADVIQSFIEGCPLVEDLRLIHCTGIGRLEIATLLKLSTVELHECHGLVWVKLELASLVSFLYWGKKTWECKINLAGCENLKHLTLKDVNLTDELFQDDITKFPNLEKLVLRECYKLERITILSLKLKELSVIGCKKLQEANIDAPNVSVLEYSGEKMPFSSMHIAGLHEAKLHLDFAKKNRFSLFGKLLIFLQKFENNGAWKLIVTSNKNITIHEELGKIKYPSSNDLKLELIKSPMKLKGYVDNLLRMTRPKTLSLVSSSNSEFLKFLNEKINSREENPKCCTYYSKKCWLHHIKDVTLASENGGTTRNLQKTTFGFNWQP